MRACIVFAILACFSCSASVSESASSDRATAKLPNPIAAPSAGINPEVGQENAGDPGAAPEEPKGPLTVEFTDAKFSLVLPSADWAVHGDDSAAFVVNEKLGGFIMLHLREDVRPLKDIAQGDWQALKDSGQFELMPVKVAPDSTFAMFVAKMTRPDGTKAIAIGVYLRNPGDPKQTVVFVGTWDEGNDAAAQEILGIIGSLAPIP